MPLRKVLVANRGEIAVRIVRGLKESGIASVAIYSDADRGSLHVRLADEAAYVGPAPSALSYLKAERILDIAREFGADAIHPGYGFLSENASFAEACESAGIVFIGPSSRSIALMGSKTEARKIAVAAGVPVVPGTKGGVLDPTETHRLARQIGYPVMIKAAAGGGGKGMRQVLDEASLDAAIRDASSEAQGAFGSSEVYMEKLLVRPRHIEIQVLGDHYGHMIHLGERECSIQRRHQKVIEECPSPLMSYSPELRERMGEAAVRAARQAGYYNAGTVEFLVDEQQNFYFLEMNTRLQVEHPVTELVTGVDLVRWQLRIAAGEPLTLRQQDIQWRGHAIECRLYAEDPDNGFFPSPGVITAVNMPSGPGIRLDSAVYVGRTVPLEYDPLLAKLAVVAETREFSIDRMLRALEECHISGIKTNLNLFQQIFQDLAFLDAELHTSFIEEFFERRQPLEPNAEREMVAALVALREYENKTRVARAPAVQQSRWTQQGRAQLQR